MKILQQLGIILAIWMVGELISGYSGIPVPGSVIGMIILFLLLTLKIIKVEMLEEVGDFFMKNLAFFFVPPGVALMSSFGLLQGVWVKLVFIIIITTVITIVVAGLTVQLMAKRGEQ